MSQTLEAALEQKTSTTFELVDRRKSGYQQKGTENTPNPICLDASKINLITLTSEMCLGKGKGYAKTQYVPNAPVIHLDDMWKDSEGMLHSKAEKEQSGWTESKGLKSLGYNLERELKNAKELKIGFQFGILSLDNYGGDPTLLTYLNNHHCNVDRPNADEDIKPHSGLFKFRCLKQETKAAAQLENIDKELAAAEYVNSLRTKKGDKFLYTDLNKAKINATLRILDLRLGFQPDEYSKKHLLIKQYADANPVQFVSYIEDAFNQYKIEIGKAISYKVLEISKQSKEVKLITDGLENKKESRVILSLESDTNEGRTEELSIHFINDSGIMDYKEVLMQIALAGSKN